MKNLLKIVAVFGLTMLLVQSCSKDDKIIDQIFDDVTNGAVLRTLNTPITDIVMGATTNQVLSIDLEEQDAQNGGLFERVDVYWTFTDNSILPGAADLSFPEELFTSVPASAFTGTTDNGLPSGNVSIAATDIYNRLGFANVATGDTFVVRLALVLTDGRVFTTTNTNSTVLAVGGFFNSPFQYGLTMDSGVTLELTNEGDNFIFQPAPTGTGFDADIAVVDQDSGNNFASMDVYLEFIDNNTTNTPDDSFAEFLLETLTPADFVDNADGFPSRTFSYDEATILNGLTIADLEKNDEFKLRFAVNTVDGRVVTTSSVPFTQSIPVLSCAVPNIDATMYLGDYTISTDVNSVPTANGATSFGPIGTVVTIELGATVNERVINNLEYVPEFGFGTSTTMTFTFNNCFTAMSTTTIAGITCAGPPIVFEENATNSEFDGSDPNAEFLVSYLEDTQASCGGPYPNSVIGFTKL